MKFTLTLFIFLSAVPTIARDGQQIIRLSGEILSPSYPTTTGSFNSHCPQAMPKYVS